MNDRLNPLLICSCFAILQCGPLKAPAPGPASSGARNQPPQTSPSTAPAAVERTPFGNAEESLLAHLGRSSTLHRWVLGANGPDCEPLTFTNVSADGTRINEAGTDLFLHSGALQAVQLGVQHYGLHGHSPVSLLVKGQEWFFTREHCRARGLRYPPLAPPVASGSPATSGAIATALGRGSSWRIADGQRVLLKPLERAGVMGYAIGDAEYEVRFYPAHGSAWLRGPSNREPASDNERRLGLYRLTLGSDHFELGARRFCLDEGGPVTSCPAPEGTGAPVPIVPGLATAGEIIDAAAAFWRYAGPFYVPLLAESDVTCQEIDLHVRKNSYDPPIFRIVAEGVAQTINVRRTEAGFAVRLGAAFYPTIVGYAPDMVVHGRDEESFLVNGSRWFLERAGCEHNRGGVKPTNFGLADKTRAGAQNSPGSRRLKSEYFALEAGSTPASCARVSLTRLAWPMGRLRIERAAGPEERDYDFYPIADALWLGPRHEPNSQRLDRLGGKLIRIERSPGQLRVDQTLWFEKEASCLSALELRSKSPARSEPAGKAGVPEPDHGPYAARLGRAAPPGVDAQ